MANPNGTFPVKQMYDEEGNPFYPITILDLICGTDAQKRKLQSAGANIRQVDLTPYMYITYSGAFNLWILNDFIYLYDGHITYTDEVVPFPVDEDLIIARDIPDTYRSKTQLIHCSTMSGYSDRVVCWLDTTGKLWARITPKYIHRDDQYTLNYVPSVVTLDFTGMYFRTGGEDDLFDGQSLG